MLTTVIWVGGPIRSLRVTALALVALALGTLPGCFGAERGFGPRIEAGVLITESGDAYITTRPCTTWKVTAMELRYRPAAASKPAALEQVQVAMRYEFDPPVDAARAFGPIDPDQRVAGAELVEFDQDVYDLAMATKTASLVDEPTSPVAEAVVEYQNSEGEWHDVSSFWFADQTTPTTWYAPGYGKPGVTEYECDDGMGWDLSMVP